MGWLLERQHANHPIDKVLWFSFNPKLPNLPVGHSLMPADFVSLACAIEAPYQALFPLDTQADNAPLTGDSKGGEPQAGYLKSSNWCLSIYKIVYKSF